MDENLFTFENRGEFSSFTIHKIFCCAFECLNSLQVTLFPAFSPLKSTWMCVSPPICTDRSYLQLVDFVYSHFLTLAEYFLRH